MQALGNRAARLRRNVFALAVVAVGQAVIRAHDIAAVDPPLAERRAAMRTDIARAHQLTVRAEDDQRLVEQRHADGLSATSAANATGCQ